MRLRPATTAAPTTYDFSGSFNNTLTFTPTLLGEFRYGYSKQNYNRVPVGGTSIPASSDSIPASSSQSALEGEMFPHFGFGGNGELLRSRSIGL